MSTDFTMTALVESLKNRGLIPVAEKTFDEDDLIRFMDEELRNYIVPKIMEVRENYFVEYETDTLLANQSRYNIPTRAIGMKTKRIFWLDNEGRTRGKLYQVDIDQIPNLTYDESSVYPQYFYFIDNYIELLPSVGDSVQGSIRKYFFQRRNRLIPTSQAGLITQIAGNQVTINSVPLDFSANVQYDFVKGTPGFQNLAIDQTPVGVSGTSFTFGSLPTSLALGDWLCLSGESPIPQLPLEAFPLLAQQGLYVTLQALNDVTGAEKAKSKRDEMLTETIRLVGIRSEDDAKTIVSGDNIGNYVMGGFYMGGQGSWPR